MLYQMVELEEGVDVQYLGVYALKWKREWGPPSVGFVEPDQHERLLQEHTALQELLAVQDATIAKLGKITTTSTCCAYCGAALTEYIKVCPEHIETLEAEVASWRTRCAEVVIERNRYILELKERLVNLIF